MYINALNVYGEQIQKFTVVFTYFPSLGIEWTRVAQSR